MWPVSRVSLGLAGLSVWSVSVAASVVLLTTVHHGGVRIMLTVLLPWLVTSCVVAIAGYVMCCCHCLLRHVLLPFLATSCVVAICWLCHVLLPFLVTSCVVAIAGYVMCCFHCLLPHVLLPLVVTSRVVAIACYVMCCFHCRLRHAGRVAVVQHTGQSAAVWRQ